MLDKQVIEEYLNGSPIKDICLKFNENTRRINSILDKATPKIEKAPRVYSINDRYFSQIDSERKAYWLGLLYADGCQRTRSNQVILSLSGDDKYLLEELKKDINFGGPIYTAKKYPKHTLVPYRLEMCNKILTKDLNRLGLVPKKSLILQFPTSQQVPDHLIRHFIRGYFDGDGSISNKRTLEVSLISSFSFSEKIHKFLQDYLEIACYLKTHQNGKNKSVVITLRASIIFLDYIYSQASVKMERKFLRFKNFILNYNHGRTNGGSYIKNDRIDFIILKWKNIFNQEPQNAAL